MYDLNDAGPQLLPMGELIPDGTFAKLQLKIRPGGSDGAAPEDRGLLKAARDGDVKMLDCELIIVDGPMARRKFWQNFTVMGGKRNDKGDSIAWNMSKASFKAMIDSAVGLDPADKSDASQAKRKLLCLKHLDGIIFAARIMVEPATSDAYQDQNRLANVVVPGEPQYKAIMAGEAVAPDPVNAKPKKAKGGGTAAGAGAQQWSNQGGGGANPAAGADAQASTAGQPAWMTG